MALEETSAVTLAEMELKPQKTDVYHVFLASPGDMAEERNAVRRFFAEYNRTTARQWGVSFEVIDWENYSSVGVGRPQELINQATLETFRNSLALVIGLIGQRFGEPTGEAESGTEEEFNWALESWRGRGFPEIKWFFRKIEQFHAPSDPEQIQKALEQWKKVRAFRDRLKRGDGEHPKVYFAEFGGADAFADVLRQDLSLWLADPARPWAARIPSKITESLTAFAAPSCYYENVVEEFRRLDIGGIDNDRAFEIPLSDIYLRLRVIFDEDTGSLAPGASVDTGPLDIHGALQRYQQLVIVGDPGSGKSTFLKFIALIVARSMLEKQPTLAAEELGIKEPLPIPIFVSCWDLSDYLRSHTEAKLSHLIEFLRERLIEHGWTVASSQIEEILTGGGCCLLFDGLDEVPTEQGRSMVSRLLEQCVSRFPQNRYVVTSRVRAYTGGTMLKGKFVRSDVQQLTPDDRRHFLRNWFAILLRTSPEQVLIEGSEGRHHFDTLTNAIEGNSRLRVLAVNPLLLTVIAIVHWNRKRLPEQRTDLYDECVDVLLGQRKEAERALRTKRTESLDQTAEDKVFEDRAWTRKRFAEIALQILTAGGDELTKCDVIRLLTPRFLMRRAEAEEEANSMAERFLDRQELKSGLLVSRKSHSYRFVHLTFQEYLAAWSLANQEFGQVIQVIETHLRSPRWFETLQLLGAEWAKSSDEKLDQYVKWLLSKSGTTVREQAPIVALCANIVRDTADTAGLKPDTQSVYERAVKGTLAAFGDSDVSETTQLEILEALGKLGAAVKEHLVQATKCSRYPVRRRAIEMLVPHLPDDDLFSMRHLLNDRSQEPIATFVAALLERDWKRTVITLRRELEFSPKAAAAILRQVGKLSAVDPQSIDLVAKAFYTRIDRDEADWRCRQLQWIVNCYSKADECWKFVEELIDSKCEPLVRADALERLVRRRSKESATWAMVAERAKSEDVPEIRAAAVRLLAQSRGNDSQTWVIVELAGREGQHILVRQAAFTVITEAKPRDPQLFEIIIEEATQGKEPLSRELAVYVLSESAGNELDIHELLGRIAKGDTKPNVRLRALRGFCKPLNQAAGRELADYVARNDPDSEVRRAALSILACDLEFTSRILLLEDPGSAGWRFDGPCIDPAVPFNDVRIARIARLTPYSTAQVRDKLGMLSQRLNGLIKIAT